MVKNVRNRVNKEVLEALRERRREKRITAAEEASATIVKETKIETANDFKSLPSKKLCVGSIFTNCEELSMKWFDLQMKYLRATVDDFDHVSVVQKGDVTDEFKQQSHVLPQISNPGTNSKAHVNGLNALRDYFTSVKEQYDYFLFIDMDAFPIRKDWLQLLSNKLTKRGHEIAVALRSENLEQRLHSSILLTRSDVVSTLTWGVSKVGQDLIGNSESDVQLTSHQKPPKRNKSFVMLRSNMHQIHPLLCGVYYDLFYHHCCGSGRNFNMRARPYWSHVIPQKFDVMKTIDDLFADPNAFIGNLVGWEGSEYAKV